MRSPFGMLLAAEIFCQKRAATRAFGMKIKSLDSKVFVRDFVRLLRERERPFETV